MLSFEVFLTRGNDLTSNFPPRLPMMEHVTDRVIPPPPNLPPPPRVPHNQVDLPEDDPFKEKRRQKELQFHLVGAIEQGSCQRVDDLLKDGVDPNCRILLVKTPLILAVEQPQVNTDLVLKLLQAGADPNKACVDRVRMSPLHIIAKSGDVNLAKILLHRGADINIQDRGNATALHYAVHYEHREMFKYLLKSGAKIDISDMRKRTVFHRACEAGNFEFAQILLQQGHDINSADCYKWTQIFHSVFFAQSEMVKFLIEHGAHLDTRDIVGQSLLDISGLTKHASVQDYTKSVSLALSTSFGYEAQQWGIPSPGLSQLLFRLQGGQIASVPDLFEEYHTITAMILDAGADPRLYTLTGSKRPSKTLELLLQAGAQIHGTTLAAILESGSLNQDDKDWFQTQYSLQFTLRHQCRFAIRRAVAATRCISSNIDALPLPSALKTFLKLDL